MQQQQWVRFEHGGETGFGTLEADGTVREHSGNMFDRPVPTGRVFVRSGVRLLTPTEPTKVIALWNNFHALGAKLNLPVPAEPLYLLKAPNSYLAPGAPIKQPLCDGKVVFEGELGIVIGRTATAVPEHVSERLVRPVGARQGLRHLLSDGPCRGHRARPRDAHRDHAAQWRGAAELSDQRHAFLGAATREPDLLRHDAVPR